MEPYSDRALARLKAEITKTFASFNRPIQKPMLDMKAELLQTTLSTLAENKISDFFDYIRANETSLPSDGRLKQILRDKPEYSSVKAVDLIPQHTEAPSSAKWVKSYMKALKQVLNGKITPKEAYRIAEEAEKM